MLVEETEPKVLSGDSGVAGFGPPLFLAAKNTVFPDAEEVKALEQYVQKQLYGRIQNKETFEVHAFLSKAEGQDGPTTFSYAYPPVFNLYLCMYRIAKDYGLTEASALDYLRLAQCTAMAYLARPMESQSNFFLGHPGEGTLSLIIEALRREGLDNEAAQLQRAISNKLGALNKRPFVAYGVIARGRYWVADTTGISGIYWLSRSNNWKDGLTSSTKILTATRGAGRHWIWYGCDLAWASDIAKYPTLEAAALKHPSACNAGALLDAAVLWRNAQYAELGYAGLLAPWARVKPNGEPQGFYAWEPKINRFDPWSGDVDAALAPTFFFLGSFVALDPVFGLVGFGCNVTADEATYTVTPADGMQKRVVSVPHRLVFEVGADLIGKVTVSKNSEWMDVEIVRGRAEDHEGRFALSGLPAGTYGVSLDGGEPHALTSEQLAAGITIPFAEERARAVLRIARHTASQ